MRIPFWPRTLAWQLIAVTAMAVIVSNMGVALWFEHGNQQQNESSVTERMVDRAATVANTLVAVPARSGTENVFATASPSAQFNVPDVAV